jgi:hypothetical protein
MATIRHSIINGVSWAGSFAGLVAGLLTYLVFMMLGIGFGGYIAGPGAMSELAWGALVWLALTVAAAGYFAGFMGVRAAPAIVTRRAGWITGMIAGALLLMAITWMIFSSASSLAGAAFNTARSVLGVPNINMQQSAQVLGLEDELATFSQGFDQQSVERIIAEQSPQLSQPQVSAAASVVTNVISTARERFMSQVGLGNLGQIDTAAQQQGQYISQQLSGPQFTQRLEQQGLSSAQAQEVSQVIQGRVQEVQQQLNQAASTIRTQATELSEQAAEGIANAAWAWLVMAVLVVGLSTLGGRQGSSRIDYETEEALEHRHHDDTPRDRPEPSQYAHH